MYVCRLISLLMILFFYIFLNNTYADLNVQAFPGFYGYQKNNRWLPVRVILSSEDNNLECIVSLSIQNKKIYAVPLTLYHKSRKTVNLYVSPQKFYRNVTLEIDDINGKNILKKDVSINKISEKAKLILVVEQSNNIPVFPINTNGKTENQEREPYTSDMDAENENIYVSYSTVGLLPTCWKGYDSVDIVVLGNVSADEFSQVQRIALIDWICSGGVLVVSGGTNSHNLRGTFIENLLPVELGEIQLAKPLDSLSQQFGFSTNIFSSIIITSSKLIKGGKAIVTTDNDKIIIAERMVGLGKCVFLAYNYLDPAFRSWKGNRYLLSKILLEPTIGESDIERDLKNLFSINTLQAFSSHKFIGIFLLAYVLCFSSIFFFFRKWNLSYLTTLIIVVLFTIGSLGFNYVKEKKAVLLNDFSIIKIFPEYKRLSINSYFSLFSPKSQKFTITLPKKQYLFVNQTPLQDTYNLKIKENDEYQVEITKINNTEKGIFYGETYIDFGEKPLILIDGKKLRNNIGYDINNCYVFDNGYYDHVGNLKNDSEIVFRMDRLYAGDIIDKLSLGDENRRKLINIFRKNINVNHTDKMIIGWIDNSALSTFAKIDIGRRYKSYGMTLAIIYF